jgi:hypothetical protein
LVFEVWVEQFHYLVPCPAMPSLWTDFLKVLANNLNYCPRISVLHDETVEMLKSMMRLLFPSEAHISSAHKDSQANSITLLLDSWFAVVSICKFLPTDLKVVDARLVADVTALEQSRGRKS